ncbi:amino acid adenylation domain-containing protein [Rapidithrix thailandica]|uniref:Amino acid adenylation domain-containing protein n=1 Tax=Rapidithrix thailandica TaxID=413964 RepID=A0AAW9SLD5_9BACT
MNKNSDTSIQQYTLSPVQQRIWSILPQISNPVIAIKTSVKGRLNIPCIQQAIEQLGEKYNVLRFNFVKTGAFEFPLQAANTQIPYSLEVLDLSENAVNLPQEDIHKKTNTWLESPVTKAENTLELLWIKTAEEESQLWIKSHPLIMDLKSMHLFLSDFSKVCEGTFSSTSETTLPYENYAQWQNELLSEPETEGLHFFKEMEQQDFSKHILPFEKNTEKKACNLNKHRVEFPLEVNKALQKQAEQLDVEIYQLLAGLFAQFLSAYDKQENMLLGISHYERVYEELEYALGAMTKTLPLRLSPGIENTLFFEKLKEEDEAITDWEDFFSFENAGQTRDTPFAYGISMLPATFFHPIGNTITFQVSDLTDISEPFGLRLLALEKEEGLQTDLYYQQGRFTPAIIHWLGKQWQHFLRRKLSLISNEPQFIPTENASDKSIEKKTVLELLEKQVERKAQQEAIRYQGQSLSYRDLDEKSNAVARLLQNTYGVKAGKRVALLLNRSEWLPVAIWGVLKAGGAYVPIDTAYPVKRIKQTLESAQCSAILTTPGLLEDMGIAPDEPVVVLNHDLLANISPHPVHTALSEEDLAYLIFTSGSTGKPKGVMISHGSLSNYVQWAGHYYFDEGERATWGMFTSLAFDLTVTSLFVSLCYGQRLFIADQEKSIARILQEFLSPEIDNEVDTLKLTPSHITMLKNLGHTSTSLKKIILGGEALEKEHISALYSWNPDVEIYNEYGPTEATVGCIVKRVSIEDERILIGRGIAQTYLCIVDDTLQPVEEGMAGELYISGKCLAKGYLGMENLTAKVFTQFDWDPTHTVWYKSGDLVRQTLEGEFEYLGRVDKQIKIRGFRIEPAEIQAVLQQLKGVRQSYISVMELEGQKILIAFLMTEGELVEETLFAELHNRLPDYMIPGMLVKVDAFPLTTNGKTDEKALLTFARQQKTSRERAYVAPRNPLETQLQEIWQEVLQQKPVSITDDFFACGGNSLSFSQLLLNISQRIGIRLSFTELFEFTVLEKQAEYLAGKETGHSETSIPLAPKQKNYPLSPAQEGIWKASQSEASNIAYNMPILFKIKGHVDLPALERSISLLIDTYESLRTIFVQTEASVVRQQILGSPQINEVFQCISVDPESNEETLDNLFKHHIRQPFNLVQGPLIRFHWFKLHHTSSYLLFNMHHIIGDNWTMKLFFHQLFKTYLNLTAGQEAELLKPALQYKDYTVWLQNKLNSPEGVELEKYWLQLFSEELEPLNMPTDTPRPDKKTYEGNTLHATLDAEETNILRQFTQQHEGTLFMSLMVVLNALFHKYTGQEDIVIGAPVAGREHSGLQEQIGLFVNTLALRNAFSTDDTINELYKTIRQNTLEAYTHQWYPFDTLLKKLDYPAQPGRSPLFDVMIVLQNIPYNPMDEIPESLSVQELTFDWGSSKYDFCFFFIEEEDHIHIHLEYDKVLYSTSAVHHLLRNIKHIISQLPEVTCLPDITLQTLASEAKEEDAFLSQMMKI